MLFAKELCRTLGRVLRAHWAEILVIQFVAGTLQGLHHALAVDVGRTDAMRGMLLNGLGTLWTVIGLVAICVVCHDSLRSTDQLPQQGWARWRRIAEVFSAAILPFFLTHVAWGMSTADLQKYARGALNSLDFSAGEGGAGSIVDLRFTTVTLVIIVIAFLGRVLVKRFLPPLGGLRLVLTLFLEAVWAFLAALLLAKALDDAMGYAESTNLAVRLNGLADSQPWAGALRAIWDAVITFLPVVFTPLLWATLAGLTIVRGSFSDVPLSRRMQAAVQRMPHLLADAVAAFVVDIEGRWVPVVGALATMVRAGAVALAGAVLASVITALTGGWLTYALAHLPSPAGPYTRLLGGVLIDVGAQLTLAATMVIALVSFDTLRLVRGAEITDPTTVPVGEQQT